MIKRSSAPWRARPSRCGAGSGVASGSSHSRQSPRNALRQFGKRRACMVRVSSTTGKASSMRHAQPSAAWFAPVCHGVKPPSHFSVDTVMLWPSLVSAQTSPVCRCANTWALRFAADQRFGMRAGSDWNSAGGYGVRANPV
jgi:hypothetical protein